MTLEVLAREIQTGEVPGVELAQVAGGALLAEMLDGAGEQPVELGEDFLARGVGLASTEQTLEQPRVAEAAAGEHDRRDPCLLVGGTSGVGVAQPAGEDHGNGKQGGKARGEGIVGNALVVHGGRAGVKGDGGDTGLRDETLGELKAGGVARTQTGAQLDGDRQPRARNSGTGHVDRERVVGEQRGTGAGATDLGHGTAHVEVDRVGTRGGDSGGRGAHDRGVLAEELNRNGPTVALGGMDAKHLHKGALVAVVKRMRGDHLRDGHASPKALGLKTNEPIANPRKRRKHDAIGHAQRPESPRRGEVRSGRHTEENSLEEPAIGRQVAAKRKPRRPAGAQLAKRTAKREPSPQLATRLAGQGLVKGPKAPVTAARKAAVL